jgi:hypothetical protein
VEIFPGFAAAEVLYRVAPKAGGGPNHAAM